MAPDLFLTEVPHSLVLITIRYDIMYHVLGMDSSFILLAIQKRMHKSRKK